MGSSIVMNMDVDIVEIHVALACIALAVTCRTTLLIFVHWMERGTSNLHITHHSSDIFMQRINSTPQGTLCSSPVFLIISVLFVIRHFAVEPQPAKVCRDDGPSSASDSCVTRPTRLAPRDFALLLLPTAIIDRAPMSALT